MFSLCSSVIERLGSSAKGSRQSVSMRLVFAASLATAVWNPVKSSGDDSPPPRLKEMCDFLGLQSDYGCEMVSLMEIKSQELNHRQETKYQFKLQRPGRIALVHESGPDDITIISDNQTLSVSVPTMKRYVQNEAPLKLEELLTSNTALPLMMLGPTRSAIPIGGDTYYQLMMAGVTSSELWGEEDIDGFACQRFDMEQKDFDWSLWIRKGDQPLPMKISVDLAKQAEGGLPNGTSIESMVLMRNWNLSPAWTDQDFEFNPPAGWEKVDSLLAAMQSSNPSAPHVLIGKPAPPFATTDLGGQVVEIEDAMKEHVVVLDFWATWCMPCIEALPKVAKVTAQFQDRGVRFYAVNVGEDSQTVQEFLKKQSLNMPVLLDEDGEISRAYSASAIPQTVIIGRSGIVEVVHIGATGQLEQQLTHEIDQLLSGKSLAEEALAKAEGAKQQREQQANPFGTKEIWKTDGHFRGVAVDAESGTIIASEIAGALKIFDYAGKLKNEVSGQRASVVRLANLRGDAQPEVLLFPPWGTAVVAQNLSGEVLWKRELGQGIDDVCARDINDDGYDEVIIGYNGSTGLHVLDENGELLWKNTSLGNVWHVAAGDVDQDGRAEVLSTSARGQVHTFTAGGDNRDNFSVSIYATMLGVLEPTDPDRKPQIIIAGAQPNETEGLVSIDAQGNENFSLTLPTLGTNFVDDLAIDNATRVAAAAVRGGLVHVINLDTGKLIATVNSQSEQCSVAWLPREGKSPLLIVASDDGMTSSELER